MAKITFYQQQRRDGGMRMGLDCNGETLLHSFHEGSPEYDPVLLWYINIRCDRKAPELRTPADAHQWLVRWSTMLRDALYASTDEFSSGIDVDIYPAEWMYPKAPKGWRVRVVVSAMRQMEGLQIADKIRQLAENWPDYVGRLQPLAAV